MCLKKDHNMSKGYRPIKNDRFIIQEDKKEIKQIHLKAGVCNMGRVIQALNWTILETIEQ